MREKTSVYFLSEVTVGRASGDCILLENIDSNGIVRHALIDAGFSYNSNGVCSFLEKHNVKKLEFFCITHSHNDHDGSSIAIMNKFQIGIIIFKEFDLQWSPDGNKGQYERIITRAIEKNIKILGISYISLFSDEYSPQRSDGFKKAVENAKEENFIFFNENNTSFQFGSAKIKIMNWQIFDVEGNLYITGQSQLPRDTYSLENQNSLGVLLYQGNKKAFFAGDMNNYGKNVGGELIGDEDRLKYEIGKIDFLKLGHHGYNGSNTDDYFNVISPQYAIITNEIGKPKIGTLNILELKEVNYLYSTQDEYEVCVIIYNDDVTLGFGTSGIKKVKNEIFYMPENKIYSNYLKSKIQIKYDYIEKSVNNWDELKNTIEQFKYREGIYIQDNFYIIEGLIITLNTEKNNNVYNANSSILVDNFKNVKIITNQNEIVIKRNKSLIELPLFQIEKALLSFRRRKYERKNYY